MSSERDRHRLRLEEAASVVIRPWPEAASEPALVERIVGTIEEETKALRHENETLRRCLAQAQEAAKATLAREMDQRKYERRILEGSAGGNGPALDRIGRALEQVADALGKHGGSR